MTMDNALKTELKKGERLAKEVLRHLGRMGCAAKAVTQVQHGGRTFAVTFSAEEITGGRAERKSSTGRLSRAKPKDALLRRAIKAR
jgi:hypothetical protein